VGKKRYQRLGPHLAIGRKGRHIVATRRGESIAEARTHSLILRVSNDAKIVTHEGREARRGRVVAPIVDDDDLIACGKELPEAARVHDGACDGILLVERQEHEAKAPGKGTRLDPPQNLFGIAANSVDARAVESLSERRVSADSQEHHVATNRVCVSRGLPLGIRSVLGKKLQHAPGIGHQDRDPPALRRYIAAPEERLRVV